jgi:hypothetical protein
MSAFRGCNAIFRPFLTAPQKRKQNLFFVFVFAKKMALSPYHFAKTKLGCRSVTGIVARETHANLPPTLSTHHHERICITAPATSLFISMQFSSHVIFDVFLVYKTLSQ